MSVSRGTPIFLTGNDDRPLVYIDELDTANPPNRKAATGLTGLTVRLAATETGAAIHATLSKSLTELGTTGYYTAVFEGADLEAQLNNATYKGKDVYQIVGDGANINVVRKRLVVEIRG